MVEEFAATLPAEVSWTVGGEEALIKRLEIGELDLVIGGLTADTPWAEHAAVTKPYGEATGPDGKRIELVMAAPPGRTPTCSGWRSSCSAGEQNERGGLRGHRTA